MYIPGSPYLLALENRIRIDRLPFSDRGSRLLLFQERRQPDTLYLKLAERLTALIPGLSTYRSRPPFIPSLRLVDGEGRPVHFVATTYPHAIIFQTPIGEFRCVYQDVSTLSIGLPPGVASGVNFSVVPDLARPDAHGGEFKTVRNCAYTTNGELVLNRVSHSGISYDVTLTARGDSDTAITLHIQPGLDLKRNTIPFRTALAAAEDRWHRWFAAAPAVDPAYQDQYYYAWWVLGNNILSPYGFFQRESVVPSKAHYVGAWQWDNYFHALALRHTDPHLASDQIQFMLDHQQPDGMLPDAVYDEGTITQLEVPVPGAVTKPPIIAWAAMHVFDRTGDLAMLRAIYDPVVRWNSWWFGMNDDDADGIVHYAHPFSSGLDDSPLWDAGMPVEAVDLNTYLCVQMDALGRMAELLGRSRDATMWRTRSASLARRMIEHFYDPTAGLFWSKHNHESIRVLTPFSLYPLWTGQMPAKINERLLAHLRDPRSFWGIYPLPTVALSDPTHDPEQMWRGPVWININYIFVEALQRIGQRELAGELAEHTLRLVMGQSDIYEYYHPVTGEPPPKAAPMFSWSAACFIDLAIRMSRREFM
ncbi:MAG: hypothetical protein HGA19_12460 [Oscillochloris sp.]|nr:hypothetical protein [Oscillochloris sp.]